MNKENVIYHHELVKVVFTPVINYESHSGDYSSPSGFIYFLSQHHERYLNRKREELKTDNFKKIFGIRYACIDCETKDCEKQEGLLIQLHGNISNFIDGHREEESSLLIPEHDERLFYFDSYNPIIPDYVQTGKSADLIKRLEERAESIRQQEIEKFRRQNIETILLDHSQISDNFLVLLSKDGNFLPKAD